MGLFVDRFIEFNLDRYKDDVPMKALFTGLTESDLSFELLAGSGTNVRSLTVKSATRNFIAVNQTYHAADLHNADGYDLVDPVVQADLATVKAQSTPGVYAYKDVDGVTDKIIVLLPYGTAVGAQQAAAKVAFTTAVHVVIQGSDIVSDAAKLTVDGPTIYGQIPFALGVQAIITIPDTDYGQLTYPEGS
jgi:hypothetical protein